MNNHQINPDVPLQTSLVEFTLEVDALTEIYQTEKEMIDGIKDPNSRYFRSELNYFEQMDLHEKLSEQNDKLLVEIQGKIAVIEGIVFKELNLN